MADFESAFLTPFCFAGVTGLAKQASLARVLFLVKRLQKTEMTNVEILGPRPISRGLTMSNQ